MNIIRYFLSLFLFITLQLAGNVLLLPHGMVLAQEEIKVPLTLELTVDPPSIKIGRRSRHSRDGEAIAKLTVTIKEGYHIFSLKPDGGLTGSNFILDLSDGLTYGEIIAPSPLNKFIKVLNKNVDIYEGKVSFTRKIKVLPTAIVGNKRLSGKFKYQACREKLCLLPNTIPVSVDIKITNGQSGRSTSMIKQPLISPVLPLSGSPEQDRDINKVDQLFKERGIFAGLLIIFVSGMALNLTPCVYPMIPVTISFFSSQSGKNIGKSFFLASLYVLGMAVVYSILGVAASFTGALFGSILQNPFVLLFIAGVFIALALSMFGFYELSLPSGLTSRLSMQKGYMGAFFTGGVVGLVAAPCLGPFVLALLVYVGHLANLFLGFILFFVFALGLGLPYLVLGTCSGMITALPKSGKWLAVTKKVFGVILLGMALYYLKGLLPYKDKVPVLNNSGGVNIVVDSPISWLTSEREALEKAKMENKPVLVDFYSLIWCPACVEFENITYKDRRVIEAMKDFINVKMDVDKNPEAKELVEYYGVKGIPAIIFIDPTGREIKELRVIGFYPPNDFLAVLNKAKEYLVNKK